MATINHHEYVASEPLPERAASTIENALRVAAVRYRTDHDVAISEGRDNEGMRRVAAQFAKQAHDADALADLFEKHAPDVVIIGHWR